jgi:hypothetical protein
VPKTDSQPLTTILADDINATLSKVRDLQPIDGNAMIGVLVFSLVVAAKTFGMDKNTVLKRVREAFNTEIKLANPPSALTKAN